MYQYNILQRADVLVYIQRMVKCSDGAAWRIKSKHNRPSNIFERQIDSNSWTVIQLPLTNNHLNWNIAVSPRGFSNIGNTSALVLQRKFTLKMPRTSQLSAEWYLTSHSSSITLSHGVPNSRSLDCMWATLSVWRRGPVYVQMHCSVGWDIINIYQISVRVSCFLWNSKHICKQTTIKRDVQRHFCEGIVCQK